MERGRNWARIYEELGDGLITECARSSCGSSCCSEKRIRRPDGQSTGIGYRTTFAGEDEVFFQNEFLGNLSAIGVDVVKVDQSLTLRKTPAYIVNNCSEGESRCKMEGRKPLVCRMYPFGMMARLPLAANCPAIDEIYENGEIVGKILRVRELLGYYDNDDWRKTAADVIASVRFMAGLNVY